MNQSHENQTKTIENEISNSNKNGNQKEKDGDANQIVDLTDRDENTESVKVQDTLPKKIKKLSVPKLLARLDNKKNKGLHTNGFDIPGKTLKRLKRKHNNSWLEDDMDLDEIDFEPKQNKPNLTKRAKSVIHNQSNVSKKIDNVESNNTKIAASVFENQNATAAPGSDFKRSNLLKINYSSNKTSQKEKNHDHLVTKQKIVVESDLSNNDSEPISHDDSDCFPWKAKSIYTELLHSYFTPQSQIGFNNDTQPPAIKKRSLKYKCKICEVSGTDSKPRVSGIVTCQYGNNSNMKRHIENVSRLI